MRTNSGFRALLLVFLQNAFSWYVYRKARKGHLEVERKFSISATESESLPLRLRELEFRPTGSVTMTDTFLPPRQKGEMMRVRDEVSPGSLRSVFTLKSWVKTRDGGKERQESECEVSSLLRTLAIICARFAAQKELLSFSKERAVFEGTLNGKEMTVCIDRVSGLGKYSGHFLELEVIVPLGEEPQAARAEIFNFVETLLGSPREDVKNSYLEMLELSRQS
ncbi:MAG: CYTH domain-containing protein [Candidatus Obscuribacterales bacterium]|nr:CYTH domain-containing protein [Candidatus Obscuribacterales bacterium]